MATTAPRRYPDPQDQPVEELHSGDRMRQDEFHQIYETMPEDFKAELVGGIVYVASPLKKSSVEESERVASFQIISLEALVRMKLTSYRDKDRTHLRDLLEVGLVDATWCEELPPELAERLRALIDTPDG